ncbi:transmembrane protein 68-like [Gigantopelta aegis]|uniref:transmembrane protein 68-like n=1 Tax=Gigantopelta aegis TaxID=1735272 RepID=UPI001B88A41D|nr:transmembrane protein 68-like [Gigantopelta aegis]
MLSNTSMYIDCLWTQIEQFDISYWKWVLWVVYPVIISFLLPFIIIIFVYASTLFLFVYRQRHRLRDAYARDFWDGARKTISVFWDCQGRIWHGYEVVHMERLPMVGPAMIIYYHAVIPIDVYYIVARTLVERGRHIKCVGDRFLFNIPGWRLLMEVFQVTPGTVQSCIDVLNEGNILCISPGGVREALFSDESYKLMWGKRTGFAKVALQANVPVIPMFTQNCREVFRTPGWGRSLLRKFYEKTRLPIVPIYGFFPVKLRSFLGEPIYPESGMTAEQFSIKVKKSVESLIECHQQIPGNILGALVERFYPKLKSN